MYHANSRISSSSCPQTLQHFQDQRLPLLPENLNSSPCWHLLCLPILWVNIFHIQCQLKGYYFFQKNCTQIHGSKFNFRGEDLPRAHVSTRTHLGQEDEAPRGGPALTKVRVAMRPPWAGTPSPRPNTHTLPYYCPINSPARVFFF